MTFGIEPVERTSMALLGVRGQERMVVAGSLPVQARLVVLA